ncbi:MAG: hypothetical protein ACRC1K_16880 [Planctomycetia bacterium]
MIFAVVYLGITAISTTPYIAVIDAATSKVRDATFLVEWEAGRLVDGAMQVNPNRSATGKCWYIDTGFAAWEEMKTTTAGVLTERMSVRAGGEVRRINRYADPKAIPSQSIVSTDGSASNFRLPMECYFPAYWAMLSKEAKTQFSYAESPLDGRKCIEVKFVAANPKTNFLCELIWWVDLERDGHASRYETRINGNLMVQRRTVDFQEVESNGQKAWFPKKVTVDLFGKPGSTSHEANDVANWRTDLNFITGSISFNTGLSAEAIEPKFDKKYPISNPESRLRANSIPRDELVVSGRVDVDDVKTTMRLAEDERHRLLESKAASGRNTSLWTWVYFAVAGVAVAGGGTLFMRLIKQRRES